MKKILFALSLCLITAASFAQTTEPTYKPLLSATNGTALDTATNTTAKSQLIRLPGTADVVTICATVTEISGTTAGTVKLYGSLDGVGYAEIDTAKVFSPADQVAAQSYYWSVNPSKFTYYKTTYTPTGTMAAKIKVGVLVKK